jgi:hypothetical protein
LTIQGANLYGTTLNGGAHGVVVVFQLKQRGSNWTINPLYSFAGASDGASPYARVVFDPNSLL